MNNTRRAMIRKAQQYVTDATNLIELAYEQEDEALNSVPENMSSSQKYINMEIYVENLENAVEIMQEAKDVVDNILTQ